jgi:hypothetical protein
VLASSNSTELRRAMIDPSREYPYGAGPRG